MATSGDMVEMKAEFERPLTDEKVAERFWAIAEFLQGDDE